MSHDSSRPVDAALGVTTPESPAAGLVTSVDGFVLSPGIVHRTGLLAQACSLGVIGIAALVLLGWTLDVPVLMRLGLGVNPMASNTAIGLLAAGGSLYLLLPPARPHAAAARGLASLALLLGSLTLLERLHVFELGIDG